MDLIVIVKYILIYIIAIISNFAMIYYISHDEEKRNSILIYIISIIIFTIQIYIISLFPQYKYTPIDALKFLKYAEAMYNHRMGSVISTDEYLIFPPRHTWGSITTYSYSYIFSGSEWLYPLYLSFMMGSGESWKELVILINPILLSVISVLCYNISIVLFGKKSISLLVVVLIYIIFYMPVSAAFLEKDTMAAYLNTICIYCVIYYIYNPRYRYIIILFLSLISVSGVRYLCFISLIASIIISSILYIRQLDVKMVVLVFISALSLFTFSFLYQFPFIPSIHHVTTDFMGPLGGARQTLEASAHQSKGANQCEQAGSREQASRTCSIDETNLHWISELQKSPGPAIIRSLAHTFFAPYPWAIFKAGFSSESQVVLYLLGMVQWVFLVPWIIFSIFARAIEFNKKWIFILINISIYWVAYTTILGEWSTRQRAFMIGIFMIFAADGLARLTAGIKQKWRPRRGIRTMVAEIRLRFTR